MSNLTTIGRTTQVDQRIASTVKALASAQTRDVGEVAEGIGLSRASLYQKLKGERPFKAHEVDALARYFRVRVSDMFDGLGGRLFPTDPDDRDAAAELPRLDSNQKPFGNWPRLRLARYAA